MVQPIANTTIPRQAYGAGANRNAKATPAGPKPLPDDIVTLSMEKGTSAAYTKRSAAAYSSDPEFDSLKRIVQSLLERQGVTFSEAMDGREVAVDEEARREALDLISENGYWGVEQTSERIFQFAVNSAGGDVSRLEEIRGAIEKGFQMALDAFGGELPDISYQTHQAVMDKLDAWAEKAGSSEA
ncbi:hypothetical protein JCM14469_05460 [Desulfatiferula olefinivorans]